MALPEGEISAEQYRQSTDVIERPGGGAEVVEWSSVETSQYGQGRLEKIAAQVGAAAGEAVSTARESANNAYSEVRSGARAGYSQFAESAQNVMRLTAKSAQLAREQFPLQTLGVLAGFAFLVGVALRIWRSHELRNA